MKLERLFQEDQKIQSERLLLRPVREEDAEGLLPMYSDNSIYRYRPGMPRTSSESVKKVIRRFRQNMEQRENAAFTILDRISQEKVMGLVEVFHLDPRVEQAEIGYTIVPMYQGKGIATEAIGDITDYLIKEIGFNRVRATAHVENAASHKALLKNGFILEGKEREGEFWQGIGFVDIYRFAKLKADYGRM